MTLRNIVEQSYGYDMVFTIKQDSVVQDISAYSTVAYLFEDPDNVVTSHSGSLYSDGTDGKVTYTVEAGDIDQSGNWRVQVVISNGSASIATLWLSFRAKSKLA